MYIRENYNTARYNDEQLQSREITTRVFFKLYFINSTKTIYEKYNITNIDS